MIFNGAFQLSDRWISRNGDFGVYEYSCLVRSDSLVVVQTEKGAAGRFTLRPGDACNSSIGDERAMITKTVQVAANAHLWHGIYFHVPALNIPGGTWNMIWQDEEDPSKWVNTAIYISSKDGKQYWDVRYSQPMKSIRLGEVTPGWHEWMVHVQYSKSGIIEFFLDGVKVHSDTSNNLVVNNGKTTISVGLYRNPQPITLSIDVLHTRIGTSRTVVEYGGTTIPPPMPPGPTLEMGGFGKLVLFAGSAYILILVLEEVKKP